MLRIVTPRTPKTITYYELVFDDGENNGFGFPCDKHGNLIGKLSDSALANLSYAKSNPQKFVRYNEVVEYVDNYIEPAHGICRCGNEVILEDMYYGACRCEKCGQWYNIYGQELVPPEYWEIDPSEEEW